MLAICSITSTSVSAQVKNKVVLDSIPAHKVIATIIAGDVAIAKNKICEENAIKRDKLIEKQENQITDLKKQTVDFAVAVKEYQEADAASTKLNLNNQKIISKEKSKKNFWKWVAIGAGAFGIYQSVK